ncbi:hypothetical protein [uncultured Aquimarina sp.]|uniref:hypothetical protein n=1 Tax=uncultured Aquimarina sp. TaxID=575652 RepID=UPI00260E8CC2|nr:hypothetical protein [uncultured Aquimarina sp.]
MKTKQFGCGHIIDKNINRPAAPSQIEIRVVDGYGDPLQGVHIQGSVGNFATITNQNGIAHLEARPNDEFIFSHIGKETRILTFSELSHNKDIVLDDQIEPLDEVVIISKPKVKKSSVGWWLAALGVATYFAFRKKPKKVSL